MWYIKSQSYCWWSSENPFGIIETPLHSQRIDVWCVLLEECIIGLLFETTITAECYQELIWKFIALLKLDEYYVWFQQDSFWPHISRESMSTLRSKVVANIVAWLRPLDFFLRCYIKGQAYIKAPAIHEDLKARNSTLHDSEGIHRRDAEGRQLILYG